MPPSLNRRGQAFFNNVFDFFTQRGQVTFLPNFSSFLERPACQLFVFELARNSTKVRMLLEIICNTKENFLNSRLGKVM